MRSGAARRLMSMVCSSSQESPVIRLGEQLIAVPVRIKDPTHRVRPTTFTFDEACFVASDPVCDLPRGGVPDGNVSLGSWSQFHTETLFTPLLEQVNANPHSRYHRGNTVRRPTLEGLIG